VGGILRPADDVEEESENVGVVSSRARGVVVHEGWSRGKQTRRMREREMLTAGVSLIAEGVWGSGALLR